MKKPNNNDYLPIAAAHTLEHLFATYARNTDEKDSVIYVGPMGCRTGFYFLTRESIPHERAIEIVRESMQFAADFKGKIPGATAAECGNYLEHDLEGAKQIAAEMAKVLENWQTGDLKYKD